MKSLSSIAIRLSEKMRNGWGNTEAGQISCTDKAEISFYLS